ncbi:TPA: MoaD/ThiS family protein [Salmonella enterica subsp. enterica serovar Muenchen]|nr:MoaD/ThiS family protein [Salmonella enterica]
MKLTVEYLSQLKEASGVNTESFVIDKSILLNEFIKSYICKNEKLAEQLLDEKKEIKQILIVFLNDNICTINETVLNSDATITLMFPIAGG